MKLTLTHGVRARTLHMVCSGQAGGGPRRGMSAAAPRGLNGAWDFASSTDPGQVNLTILLATTFSTDLDLPDFQPLTHVMALHIAIRLPQVCSSQRVYLKGEPGPARVVGRPWALLFLPIPVPRKIQKVVFVELGRLT